MFTTLAVLMLPWELAPMQSRGGPGSWAGEELLLKGGKSNGMKCTACFLGKPLGTATISFCRPQNRGSEKSRDLVKPTQEPRFQYRCVCLQNSCFFHFACSSSPSCARLSSILFVFQQEHCCPWRTVSPKDWCFEHRVTQIPL